jgi:hypothetical protein
MWKRGYQTRDYSLLFRSDEVVNPEFRRRSVRADGFVELLRVPDGKARLLTSHCDERGVRREEDEVFSFGHAQQ